MNTRAIGTAYEKLAAEYLAAHGYRILKQNFRTRQGEIDIVAAYGDMLVFVEVKHRSDSKCGYPEEAVTPAKCRRISKTALQYISFTGRSLEAPVRFDVISIADGRIKHIENAFEYIG